MFLLLSSALALQNNALQFLENWELLVGVVNLCVTLLFRDEEADLLEALQLALNVACIFFDELSQAPDMCLEIWVLCVDHNDLSSNS